MSENAYAIGMLVTFGRFRMLDLADLTWNREKELMCPNDPIGPVDLFMVSHHGNDYSNSPALLAPLHPRIAIMNNGERKIGAAYVMKALKSSPGLQALYTQHWSANAPDDNPAEEYIANLRGADQGKWFKVSAEKNGTMVVTNARTGQSRTLDSRGLATPSPYRQPGLKANRATRWILLGLAAVNLRRVVKDWVARYQVIASLGRVDSRHCVYASRNVLWWSKAL